MRKEGHTYILNNPTIYADTVNFGTRDTTATSINTNVISDQTISHRYIIDQVNSSPYSTEKKEKIKNILEELNKELNSKPLPDIFDNLKKKFKEYFPLASPFIQQIIGLHFQGKF